MESADRFRIHFVAHYGPTNKVWGWLTTDDTNGKYAYAFWAVVGKTISFKRHQTYGHRDFGRGWMRNLEAIKLANKYEQIGCEQLLSMWPGFMEALAMRYTFMQLSNGFEER